MELENVSLGEAVNTVVGEWLNANGGGLSTNFVFAAEVLEEDGCRSNFVITPGSVVSGLGLSTYAVNWFTEQQRRDVIDVIYSDLEDEDE